MKKTYEYFWMDGHNHSGVARAPKDYDSFEDRKISGKKRIIETFKNLDEIPCLFEVGKEKLLDYLDNDMAYPLFSFRLKELIDANVEVKLYRWIKAKVKVVSTGEIVTYYMPLFENLVDTISYENSKCMKDSVVVACYSLKKINKLNLDFFPKHDEIYNKDMGKDTPYFVDGVLVVSHGLRQVIDQVKLKGINFSAVPFVDDIDSNSKEWILSVTKELDN